MGIDAFEGLQQYLDTLAEMVPEAEGKFSEIP